MKLEVIIKRVGEVRKGTSPTTGNKWASRSLLLSWEDETGESYLSAAVDEDVWESLGYQEGDTAMLNLRFRTKQFSNGFLANDIRVFIPQNAQ